MGRNRLGMAVRLGTKVFLLALLIGASATAQERVTFKEGTNQIEVEIGGKPAARYYYGGPWLKPFLHEVHAATGTVVTRGYPLTKTAGESQDHFWHHGIWYGHGDINGVDFWREFTGDPKEDAKFKLPIGRFTPIGKPSVSSSPAGGVISAEYELETHEKKILGTLRQRFRFQRVGAQTVIDAEITILADRGVVLRMGDTEEGSFGLRFADAFKQDRGAVLTNSDGLRTTEKVWGKRAVWVDYSTKIGEESVGVTIFDHPSNPKHPTFWHARGYGLCGVNPFGERDFLNDKTRDGGLTIPPGSSLRFRYRVAIHPGSIEQSDPAASLADFARQR